MDLELELSKHTDDAKIATLTLDQRDTLAHILSRVKGRPRNLIGPAWKGTRKQIAQLFAEPGHKVKEAGVTAVTSMVYDYLGLTYADLCMAARDDVVAYWVTRQLTPDPVDA